MRGSITGDLTSPKSLQAGTHVHGTPSVVGAPTSSLSAHSLHPTRSVHSYTAAVASPTVSAVASVPGRHPSPGAPGSQPSTQAVTRGHACQLREPGDSTRAGDSSPAGPRGRLPPAPVPGLRVRHARSGRESSRGARRGARPVPPGSGLTEPDPRR